MAAQRASCGDPAERACKNAALWRPLHGRHSGRRYPLRDRTTARRRSAFQQVHAGAARQRGSRRGLFGLPATSVVKSRTIAIVVRPDGHVRRRGPRPNVYARRRAHRRYHASAQQRKSAYNQKLRKGVHRRSPHSLSAARDKERANAHRADKAHAALMGSIAVHVLRTLPTRRTCPRARLQCFSTGAGHHEKHTGGMAANIRCNFL